MVWWSGPPDFDIQMKLREHCDTQIKSGGLVVRWSGGLVVWWSGGLVVWWSGGLVVNALTFCFCHAPRPKAIFEANFIRKDQFLIKKIAFGNLLFSLWWSGG